METNAIKQRCGFCMYSDKMPSGDDRCWCWKYANHVRGDHPICTNYVEDSKKRKKMEADEDE